MQNTIAVVFDFDETLAPDSTSSFLDSCGLNVPEFWSKRHHKLLQLGWDSVPGYLYLMIEESRSRPVADRITKQRLADWGKKLALYEGTSTIFSRLKKHAAAIDDQTALEFYVVSSGIGEILRNTKVAKYFTDLWACEFHYARSGEIAYPRNIISFTDKTRYLFQISKGLIGDGARTKPFEVNRKVPESKLRVPLNQFIVVGDGYTDIPCFSLVQGNGGIAIGVYDRESRDRWGKAWGFIETRRVTHLVAADYRKRSGLDDAISLAVARVCQNIKLRAMTYRG